MKKKKMTVILALLLAAGGCRSGLEATEALKGTATAEADSMRVETESITVSEKILSSIHRIEDECAAAIVRFVDGGGELRVDSGGVASAIGVASIEGGKHRTTATSAKDCESIERDAEAASGIVASSEQHAEMTESHIERKSDTSQGSMWLSIFFLCLGYFLAGAAIRITKNAKL